MAQRAVERALHSLVRDAAEHEDDVSNHVPSRIAEARDQDLDVVLARDRERLAEGTPMFHVIDLAQEIADRGRGEGPICTRKLVKSAGSISG